MANSGIEVTATLEHLIIALGRGVATAQLELDRSSIQIQQLIDADPELSANGVSATWYQMPNADMEFKLALTFQSAQPVQRPGPGGAPSKLIPAKLLVRPIDAAYANQYKFDASAASTVKLALVPVPPRATDLLKVPPRLTSEKAIELATPLLVKEPNSTALRNDARVMANFQVTSRSWYVLQFTSEGGQTATLAMVEVSDDTGKAVLR